MSRGTTGRGWLLLLPLTLLALLWSCRGAPLGVPVVDDYTFLATLRFQHPLDLFGPMGSPFYWRPIGRQLYFVLVGQWLTESPWLVAALHALLLLAIAFVLYRLMRRGFEPPVAATIAVIPLASESARVLLAWPSGAMHLLGTLGIVIALHELLAGRWITASGAALAGMLSHETAALVLPAFPLIAWVRTRSMRDVLRGVACIAGILLLWIPGYWIARAHGAGSPVHSVTGLPLESLPRASYLLLSSALNLEDLGVDARRALGWGCVLLFAAALVLMLRPSVRERMRLRTPVMASALVWAGAGLVPIAYLLPEWNAWHAWEPALALGVGFTVLLGLASPWLSMGFLALRLTALLFAPTAASEVSAASPETTSHLSFQRLARLERTVESTRRALATAHPQLRSGARVRYFTMPRLTEFGFQQASAVRYWYNDSTITFRGYGTDRDRGSPDAVLEFLVDEPWPAIAVDMRMFEVYERGLAALRSGRYRECDSLMLAAGRMHGRTRGVVASSIIQNRARAAYNRHDHVLADSLNRRCLGLDPNDPAAIALQARIEAARQDREAAFRAIQRCLELDPGNVECRELAAELGFLR